MGSKPWMNSHPSGIPSRSESEDCGLIGMIFIYLPGDIPANKYTALDDSIVAIEVTKPGKYV